MRRIPIVLFAEHPPADQRNSHGAEIRLARQAIRGVPGLSGIMSHTTEFSAIGRRLLAIEDEECSISEVVAGGDGKRAGETYGLRARKCAQPGRYVVDQVDLAQDGRLVDGYSPIRSWKRKLHGDQVLRAKSRTRGDEPQEAAAEQARSNQNHKRRGNFADRQKGAKPLAGAPASVTAGAGRQCLLEISGRGAPSGKKAERSGDSYNCGQGEQQNRGVDGHALLPREIGRENCWKYPDRPSGYQNSQCASSYGERKGLSEELLNETAATGTEGRTHSQFFAAGRGAR